MVDDQVTEQERVSWRGEAVNIEVIPELVRVAELLRQASETLDTLWWLALDRDSDGTAIRLGEASMQVHRALIAVETSP